MYLISNMKLILNEISYGEETWNIVGIATRGHAKHKLLNYTLQPIHFYSKYFSREAY